MTKLPSRMKTYIIVAMIAMAFAVALVSAQGRLSIQLGAGPAYSGYGPGYGPGYGGGYGGYNRPYGADYYGGGKSSS